MHHGQDKVFFVPMVFARENPRKEAGIHLHKYAGDYYGS